MVFDKSIKLMKKYGICPDCGNKWLGNGQGKLIIEDEIFKRECKCGFKIQVNEDGVKV